MYIACGGQTLALSTASVSLLLFIITPVGSTYKIIYTQHKNIQSLRQKHSAKHIQILTNKILKPKVHKTNHANYQLPVHTKIDKAPCLHASRGINVTRKRKVAVILASRVIA